MTGSKWVGLRFHVGPSMVGQAAFRTLDLVCMFVHSTNVSGTNQPAPHVQKQSKMENATFHIG